MATNPTFDLGLQQANQRQLQRNEIQAQQRTEQQNTVGAQLLDAINQSSNIKPTMKDDQGNVISNPAYAQAQNDRRTLLQQYTTLNSPEQHASFAQHLHGLIFGHPTAQTQQPALSPNSSPNEPSAPVAPQGQPPTPTAAAPPHPFETGHPALGKITEGIKALGEGIKNHAQAFANPLPQQAQPDPSLIAKYYKDPGEVAHERNMEMWGQRGANALAIAEERTKAMLAGKPPRFVSQVTLPDLLKEMQVDPDLTIYGTDGNEISPAKLAEMPPGTIARQFMKGSNVVWALGDQNSKTANIGGRIFDIPAVGPITSQNSTDLGQATGTLPKASTSTDQFGNVVSTQRITPTTPGITSPAQPAPNAQPTLKTRPFSSAAPVPPVGPLAAVNAQIAQGNAGSSKLNKGKPVSSLAPAPPAPLDQDGHIPAGVGNAQVREAANQLLDGVDKDKLPAKAREPAAMMARQYGWSQGAFTPREKVQFGVATNFLEQLQKSPALSVLDSFVSREKIAHAMEASGPKGGLLDRLAAYNLTPQESEFIRLYNSALGTVQGLASITRSGKSTESAVGRLKAELPNVLQSASAADAKSRIDQLLKEANLALGMNPSQVKPTSKNAPPPPAAESGPEVWVRDASGKLVKQ